MADISQIKLPDGTTYNLKDSYVRTNYRALSNNDFDTINVTELNAGDLVVTGAARFLNTINGSVSGTSSNVTSTVAIANGGTGATSAANARTNLAVPNMVSDTYPTLLPTNGSNNWIKIGTSNSSYGLLPSVAGNAGSGHNYLGTSTWYWKYAYIDEIYGTLKGNADTATTASKLSGFTSTTTSGTAIDSATQNGHVYVTGTSGIYSQNDGAAFVQAYSTSWVAQIYQDYRTGQIALRGKNNGTWQAWRKVWDSVNLTSKTAAASGTDLSLVTTGEKATWNAKASADTKNTAGSTDTSSKIFLIGATSQAANPQTYSQDTAYVGTDGCLYSGGTKVLTSHQDISGKVSKTGDTMTGALNFANATKNSIGDDVAIGDFNIAGTLGVQGLNGATGIGLIKQGETWGTSANYAKISYDGTTISVNKPFTDISATTNIHANTGNSGTAGGLSLYGSAPTSYGIAMRTTANGGKYGYVQGDWGIYNYMAGADNRGWIFVHAGVGNRASISTEGHMVLNGSLTLGGNATNTSGVRQVYNETTKSLDFVFVA